MARRATENILGGSLKYQFVLCRCCNKCRWQDLVPNRGVPCLSPCSCLQLLLGVSSQEVATGQKIQACWRDISIWTGLRLFECVMHSCWACLIFGTSLLWLWQDGRSKSRFSRPKEPVASPPPVKGDKGVWFYLTSESPEAGTGQLQMKFG